MGSSLIFKIMEKTFMQRQVFLIQLSMVRSEYLIKMPFKTGYYHCTWFVYFDWIKTLLQGESEGVITHFKIMLFR